MTININFEFRDSDIPALVEILKRFSSSPESTEETSVIKDLDPDEVFEKIVSAPLPVEEPTDAPKITSAQLLEIARKYTSNKRTEELAKIFASFGHKKLTDFKESEYAALKEKLEAGL